MTAQEQIKTVVDSFYARATQDILIGYHFRHIQDFDSHLPRIRAFWEMQLLGSRSIVLQEPLDVLKAHIPLKINFGEIGRWVTLFRATLDESPVDEELKQKWLEKVTHFQGIFERSPMLFPKA